MKILGLLLTLLVVCWLIYGQLNLITTEPQMVIDRENNPPRVPTTPQQLEQFDRDINQFVTDSAAQRARQIEENQ